LGVIVSNAVVGAMNATIVFAASCRSFYHCGLPALYGELMAGVIVGQEPGYGGTAFLVYVPTLNRTVECEVFLYAHLHWPGKNVSILYIRRSKRSVIAEPTWLFNFLGCENLK